MSDFKYAIFMYEMAALPDDQKVVSAIVESLRRMPLAPVTLVQVAFTLEEAARLVDDFKQKTCGSPYTLGVINLNMMTDVREIHFLLRGSVLGDPRTIFLASLKYMTGETYALAREKVQREDQTRGMSASCVDCYGPGNKDDLPERIGELAAAYLQEAEEREKARLDGHVGLLDSHASALLRKSSTAFYSKSMKSGAWSATRSDTNASGRLSKPDPKANGHSDPPAPRTQPPPTQL